MQKIRKYSIRQAVWLFVLVVDVGLKPVEPASTIWTGLSFTLPLPLSISLSLSLPLLFVGTRTKSYKMQISGSAFSLFSPAATSALLIMNKNLSSYCLPVDGARGSGQSKSSSWNCSSCWCRWCCCCCCCWHRPRPSSLILPRPSKSFDCGVTHTHTHTLSAWLAQIFRLSLWALWVQYFLTAAH